MGMSFLYKNPINITQFLIGLFQFFIYFLYFGRIWALCWSLMLILKTPSVPAATNQSTSNDFTGKV